MAIVLKSWTYNDVLKLDTAFAENTLTNMDIGNRAVIPPHSAPERLIHSSADKIDSMTALLMGNTLYLPHCTHLGKYDLFMLLH